MNKVQVIGTGSYVPSKVVSNDDLSRMVDTSDEWISSRTGIKERRISEGEDTSEMASKAAMKAIESAGIKPEDIDLIILGTATPDNFIPSTACIVQSNIKAMNAMCFDISAACSGFVYGLDIATQFIRTGSCKTALVIGAETLSKIINWEDRNTCVLFGDGAAAAILQTSDVEGILAICRGADGSKGKALVSSAIPVKNPYVSKEMLDKQVDATVKMDGREIFKFAVKVIIQEVEKLLADAKCSLDDIKYIVPHQANSRIIDSAAKKLGVSEEKFYLDLDKFGNTSAATIGIALDDMVQNNLLEHGDKILLIGFGGGLTYGGLIIEW
ncbi:beta-ketoacyl-ACP synthase III [Clostridium thailandense]|uniref:Beta-ketoacyl-[acyl-carrier-protein] synthase III n=1 Tax=Clostridium thailandense TaxID=2794346 RepID=A0A949WV42_9CLOT|nr:beta-ketoacyl-ACP synthase III [Clostridium thailandense]MBV7273262.1 ketoacyl-ACP synthase III [Clostridium thailandense]MCH5137287.1 ketoacyl-ACP synthase III [Clostridiaceae bacterium UIB06]